MNRDPRTRNFNTAARSSGHNSYSSRNNRGRGRRPRDSKGIVYLIILIVVVLIVAALGILLISMALTNSNNNDNNNRPSNAATLTKDQLSGSVSLSADDIRRGELVLVNGTYPCLKLTESEYVNIYASCERLVNDAGKTVPAYCQSLTETVIHRNVITALNKLGVDAYHKAGNNDLTVRHNKVLSYTDGKSEDQSGLMVDLYVYTVNHETYTLEDPILAGVYDWIFTDCYKYGFIQRGERSQFRYVGIPHATYMAKNNLSLEDYLSMLKDEYTFESENHLIVDGDDGLKYQIYYVPNSGDTTSVPVPSGSEYKYSVSGDNMGGFIVTVTLG